MSDGLPKFAAPPVVETVLGCQFTPIAGFTLAHAGWFWKKYLGDAWTKATEAPRLQDAFERFGVDRVWTKPTFDIRLAGRQSQRLQIVRSDEERMIQVQDSRFHLNWRKRKNAYPSYGLLLPEFREYFGAFERFAAEVGFGKVAPNQWELIYVNLLYKDEVWTTPAHWQRLFPWLTLPVDAADIPSRFESMSNAEWQFILGDDVGRLTFTLNHVKVEPETENREALRLQLVARGPVTDAIDIYSGFDLGHSAIVKSFTTMTSESAHKTWKRTA